MIVPTAYLPPITYFVHILREGICVEQWESYVKQTLRNRCEIDSPQGRLRLTMPVEKPDDGSRLIRDFRLSNHGNWQHQHWQALVSSYGNSPFFEYYQDDFRPLYEQKHVFLLDFNESLMQKCCELIDIFPRIHRTFSFGCAREGDLPVSAAQTAKLSDGIAVFEQTHAVASVPYYQVFASQHGFLPNLSIVDLLFNMGPESVLILQRMAETADVEIAQIQ